MGEVKFKLATSPSYRKVYFTFNFGNDKVSIRTNFGVEQH